MNYFKRVFGYVWPQWPRLVVIFFCVTVIAILFSLSFGTVMPLLKVMMGEEGLHGWVDRSECKLRYGMDFYLPDKIDLVDPNKSNIAYYLRITDVKDDGFAAKAGFVSGDMISAVGPTEKNTPSAKLLELLVTTDPESEIAIGYSRLDKKGLPEFKTTTLETGNRNSLFAFAQKTLSVVPREETRDSKQEAIVFIILMMSVVTVIRCVGRFLQDYMANKVIQVAVSNLRQDMLEHTVTMPISYFAKQGPSDSVSRMIQDTATITRGIKVLLGKAIREPMKGFAALGVAMMIDMKLSLIFLACAPAAGIMMAQLGGRMKRATKKSLLSWAAMLAKLEEIMRSLRIVKVYNRQEYESQRYAVINQRLLKQQLKIAKVDSATNPIMEIVSMAAIAAALIFGVRWVFSQKMEASAFFTLLIAICASAESFRKVSDIWNIIQQSNAAAERTFGLIDEPAEKEVADAVEIAPLRNSIVFKEIVFTYPGSERPVLKSINLSVQAGHNIAIVGANGSGKTTLVNLIPRFYDADSGNIYIDGVDITQASLSSLRDQIGLVSQNITIFNDTVAANIRYGNPDATMEEVVAAAKKSFAHEFIDPLENGYETVIGDSGTGLSGGQLQRLVIARAILKDPAILIFDEATSQVDADSESKIHAAIETFMKDRTSFVIAHRFSTVINSDIIVVMNEGNIIDQGPHRELFERCQIYKNLYETQLLKG